ncbi:putative transcription factor & lipid binding HD-SAD family [Medicago truncatula]|uniref:Putative transcription factor & lipid binding HD-SAD family n=1 Tax=Medicago truncatula TaxID=3880 RepID=A0A396HL46_MEDTR|nr:putative transcription factor & lipid binding HD-SAD family [Medicago truncatula]
MYQNRSTRTREEANQMNMEAPSSDDQESNQRRRKRTYRRHTQQQIDEMDTFFKQCPNPNDAQRRELSLRTGLDPTQIKFWFQNRRTSLKVQTDRDENELLKIENEKLRDELDRYKGAISTTCKVCGSSSNAGEMSHEEQQLRLENALLRKEIKGLNEKQKIVELAVVGMDELTKLARTYGPPLWIPTNYVTEILNGEEYMKYFPRGNGPNTCGLRLEGSKESVVVMINAPDLVDILMDVNQWSNMFCGIVSRAATLEVLSTGVGGNYDGALQVMTAEFQVPSPHVPTRQNHFVRYCKLHPDGIWVVADVSLHLLNAASASSSSSSTASRTNRRPSGCLIETLPNGLTKVTWIENVEVDDQVVQNIYKPLVNSGLAFGAKRWVATLHRQSDRLFFRTATNVPREHHVRLTPEGKKSILNLAERLVASFSTSIGSSTTHAWTKVPGNGPEVVMVMTKRYIDESSIDKPVSVVLSAATSFWLPVPPRRVFDFLRDQNTRKHWDILSAGGIVHELAHISNGRDSGNYVSLFRITSENSEQSDVVVLQENCTDVTGSYVVYAPVQIPTMHEILNGGDSSRLTLLPSGFAIFPDGCITNGGPIMNVGSGGSLVTVAFQIIVDSIPHARLALGSITTVNTLIKNTVERIRTAVMPNGI